jgi:hypothetical protein
MATTSNSLQGSNIVGVHYRVGKKIGEGSFGVIFEGEQCTFNSRHGLTLHHSERRHGSAQLADSRYQIRGSTFQLGSSALNSPRRHVQEPRKSDAPQLRDEYRSYRILSGCRAYFRLAIGL